MVAGGVLAWKVATNPLTPIYYRALRDRILMRPSIEERLLCYVARHAKEGDAQSVLDTIDAFCQSPHS